MKTAAMVVTMTEIVLAKMTMVVIITLMNDDALGFSKRGRQHFKDTMRIVVATSSD